MEKLLREKEDSASVGYIHRLHDEIASLKREIRLLHDQERSWKNNVDTVRSDIRPSFLVAEVEALRAENARLNQRLQAMQPRLNVFSFINK